MKRRRILDTKTGKVYKSVSECAKAYDTNATMILRNVDLIEPPLPKYKHLVALDSRTEREKGRFWQPLTKEEIMAIYRKLPRAKREYAYTQMRECWKLRVVRNKDFYEQWTDSMRFFVKHRGLL